MPQDRKARLSQYIESKGEVTMAELETIFSDVSSMTIRRDLEFLEKKGEILRVRGGAVSVAHVSYRREAIYTQRESVNALGKQKIAKKALSYMQTERSIFFDSGTTVMALAQLLKDERYFILTNGLNTALELSKRDNITITTVGGIVDKETLSVSGTFSSEALASTNIDIAFIATSGYSIEDGFTNGYIEECKIKKAMIQKAKKVILLMDTTKIDKNMLFTFATTDDIDVLITDNPLPNHLVSEFKKHKVELV